MSNSRVLIFILLLCTICGFLLAVTSYTLAEKQQEAKEFDQSKQMLIAAHILKSDGTLYSTGKKATNLEIKQIASSQIHPFLTDSTGQIYTLEEKNIKLDEYLEENKKTGYAHATLQLFYAIFPENVEKKITHATSFVIPVSGFGLWGPIYGYLALDKDANHVIGTTWYEHAETPGLGANITESWWQNLFSNKVIFQGSDFTKAPIGIIVVKGRVQDVYGSKPIANSAVDGISGATLTGDGVTAAYRDSLTPYRALFLQLQKESKSG